VRQGVGRRSMIDCVDDWATGVEWIGEAPHALAGSLRTRSAFLAHIAKRFSEALPQGTLLRIERVFVNTHFVVVTMWFLPMERSGWLRYWWICGDRPLSAAAEFPQASLLDRPTSARVLAACGRRDEQPVRSRQRPAPAEQTAGAPP
jgi:hypothetical protein